MRAWPFRRGLLAAVLACALLGGAGCADDGKVGAAAQPTLRPSQRAVAAASGSPARPPTPSPSDSPNASARPRTPPLAGDVIAVDPGHNGGNATHPDSINQLVNVITEKKACDTTGAETDAGYPEHAFNFDVAIRAGQAAAKGRREGRADPAQRYRGGPVRHPAGGHRKPGTRRRGDLDSRRRRARRRTGFEVIEPGLVPGYTDKIIGPSRRLGLDIRNEYHAITGEPYSDYVGAAGLDVRTDLGGLNLSKVPKVFIECANMRNAQQR